MRTSESEMVLGKLCAGVVVIRVLDSGKCTKSLYSTRNSVSQSIDKNMWGVL